MKIENLIDTIDRTIHAIGQDPIIALDELLTYATYALSSNQKIEPGRKYEDFLIESYSGLFAKYLEFMDEKLKTCFWFDAWGDIFMDFSGKYKSCRGQFFTPTGMATLAAKFTDEKVQGRQVINDCACGSARMLLAAQENAFGNGNSAPYLIGEDIDTLCCKMAAVNLCVHGCYGEIICHDSLKDPNSLRFGYLINETLHPGLGMPSIRISHNKGDFAKLTQYDSI